MALISTSARVERNQLGSKEATEAARGDLERTINQARENRKESYKGTKPNYIPPTHALDLGRTGEKEADFKELYGDVDQSVEAAVKGTAPASASAAAAAQRDKS